MTGYAPKPGDKIRVIPKPIDGVVVKVAGDGQVLLDHMRPTLVSAWPQRDHFHPSKYDFELIEAAPVPFEVGKPLTSAMGEPPDGSFIKQYDRIYVRRLGGWEKVYPYSNPGYDWANFEPGVRSGSITLEILGGAK